MSARSQDKPSELHSPSSRKLNAIQITSLSFLLVIFVFALGFISRHYKLFPYGIVQELSAFAAGAEGSELSVVEMFVSDMGGTPHRLLHHYVPTHDVDFSPLAVPTLRQRRDPPLIYLASGAPRGFRVIFGALDLEKALWGAVLIDPDGVVEHIWPLSTESLETNEEPDYRKVLYGVGLLPDGSVIFLMQEFGGGIVKVDYCGNMVWSLPGRFHHTVSFTDNGQFWTFEGMQEDFDHLLTLVDVETGRVVKRINMSDVRDANRRTHIFDLQRFPNAWDAVHGNDIDPLPAALADAFPAFEPGDLLVSFRTTNLVFVLDPDTLHVKWWRVGAWDRQHDPDWHADGTISVFSNNARAIGQHSNVVNIRPDNLASHILVDGKAHDFYSTLNGTHEITDSGTVLVTSSTQGRVFEVDSDGEIVFEFVNRYDSAAGTTLHLSDARLLATDFFNRSEMPICEKMSKRGSLKLDEVDIVIR